MNSRTLALVLVLSGTMLIDSLEVSTAAIALPSIARTFAATPALASAVMIGFAIGLGGTIIAGGRVAARFGHRRVYLWSMIAFTIASFVSGLATDLPTLVVTRLVKGACVALSAPTGLAIVASMFPDARPRARALAVYTFFGASGFSVGLVLSGLATAASWRWALVCSGPAALILLVMASQLIPATRPLAPPPPQGPGGQDPAPAGPAWSLWRAAAGGAVLNGSWWAFLVVVTFQLQSQRSWSPLATGLALLPASLPLAGSTWYAARVLNKVGTRRLILAGSLVAVLAYAYYGWADRLSAAGDLPIAAAVLPATALIGVAFVLSFAALNAQAISQCPPGGQQRYGAIFQASVQLGGATMLVAVASLLGRGSQPALTLVATVAGAGALVATAGPVFEKSTERSLSRRGET